MKMENPIKQSKCLPEVVELCARDLPTLSECFQTCLQRRKRGQWEREGVARAQYRHHLVLKSLGKHEQAADALKLARLARDQLLKENEGYIHYDQEKDELEIFDQLCSMWAGRFTGKIARMQERSVTSSA